MNTLGNNIANYRKQQSLSQEDLAKKLGVSRQSISKWERNEANPDLYNMEMLSKVLHVSMDELVGNEMAENTKAKQSIYTLIDQKLSNAKNEVEYNVLIKRITLYTGLFLFGSILLALFGFYGFFKTGMFVIQQPTFLAPSWSNDGLYPGSIVLRAIMVGCLFFGIIGSSRSVKYILYVIKLDIREG